MHRNELISKPINQTPQSLASIGSARFGKPIKLSRLSAHRSTPINHDSDLYPIIKFLEEDNEFLVAAETGHYNKLQYLIRKNADVQQFDSLGRNALHLAVINGNEQTIKLLLNAKVDPNVRDNVGCTPLSLCLLRSPSLTVAKMLLEHGATIHNRYSPTDTGLFLNFVIMSVPTAIESDIMRLLVLEYGALLEDPAAPGGRQALHYAAMSNNCELITLLAELGADLHVYNHRKQTPKEVAIAFNCKEAEFLLQSLEYNSLLISDKNRNRNSRRSLNIRK